MIPRLLISFSLLLPALAADEWIPARLSPALQRTVDESPHQILDVIVVLKNQPAAEVVAEQNAAFTFERESLQRRRASQDDHDALTLRIRRATAQRLATLTQPDFDQASAAAVALGATLLERYITFNAFHLKIPAHALPSLLAQPAVAEVFENSTQFAQLDVSVPELGAPFLWANNLLGIKTSVAIFDTGVDSSHPALLHATWTRKVFLSGNSACAAPDSPLSPDDFHGHGTHVAGILLSAGGASGLDASRLGVAYQIPRAFSYKVACRNAAGQAVAVDSDIFAALDDLVSTTPQRVVNFSFGAPAAEDDPPSVRIWDFFGSEMDLAIVLPAGNVSPTAANCGVMSPGLSYNAITVGSWHSRGTIDPTSCPGPTPAGRRKPDLLAPGRNIVSTLHNWESGPAFGAQSGSSAAAPHVAGGLALIGHDFGLDSLRGKAAILNAADLSASAGTGWGFANLAKPALLSYINSTKSNTISWPDQIHSDSYFYRADLSGDSSATLVWRRRVFRFSGVIYPQGLNQLELHAHSTSGVFLGSGAGLPVDNVRKLHTTHTGPAVFTVTSPTAYATLPVQTFALAASSELTLLSGPVLEWRCDVPATVAPGATFTLPCAIANTGDLPTNAVTAIIEWSSGFSSSTSAQAYGNIDAGAATASKDWYAITAPSTPGVYTLQRSIQSSAFGAILISRDSFPITVLSGETVSAPSLYPIPSQGLPSTSYHFSASGGASSSGHAVEYQFDFGDGVTSAWGPYTQFHSFPSPGVYSVRVRARCTQHTSSFSPYSSPRSITISAQTLPTVPNAGFESGVLGAWLPYGVASPTVSSSAAYSGSYSLSTSAGSGGVYVDFDGLTPQRFYHFTVRVKASGAAHEGLFWAHDGLGSDGVWSGWRTFSTSQWEQLQINFRATQSGMARLHLETRGATGGLLWDDVQVTPGWLSDMENGTVSPWIPFGAVTAAPASAPANELYSLALTGSGGAFYDAVGLVPGRWYHVKARVRVAAPTAVRLWLHDTQGANQLTDGWYNLAPGAWHELQLNYQANPMAAMRIHIQANTAGVVTWWDDVQVLDAWRDDFDGLAAASAWAPSGAVSTAACPAPSGLASLGQSGAGAGAHSRDLSGLRPGSLYRIRAKARSMSGGSTLAQLRLQGSSSSFSLTTPESYPGYDWRPIQIEFAAPSDPTLRLSLSKGPGSTICWDEVELLDGWKQEFVDNPFLWSIYGSTQMAYTLLTDSTNYLLFYYTSGPGGLFRDISGLTPTQRYHVSARTRPATAVSAAASLKAHDGSGANPAASAAVAELPYAQWNTLDLNFTATSNGNLRLFLDTPSATSGLYWDDVEVREGWVSDFESARLHPWVPYGSVTAYPFPYPSTGHGALAMSGNQGGAYIDVDGLQPGRRYQISARATVAPGGFAIAHVWAHDTAGANITHSVATTPGSASWNRFSLNFTATSSRKARIYLEASNIIANLFWDDVRLDEGWTSDFMTGSPTGWKAYGASAQAISYDAALDPFSLTQSGGDGGSWQDVSGLIPGEDYLILARSRSSVGASNQSILWVHDTTGANQIWSVGSTPTPYGWDERRLFYRANSTGAVRLHLANTGGSGTLYWDDIEVIPVH